MRETAAVCFAFWIATSCMILLCSASPLADHNVTLSRERRQRCRFRCLTGECIGEDKFQCDGIKDCADGSDETVEACSQMRCEGYAVRCDYGGCVDGDAKCNGVEDCPDSSDEKDCSANRGAHTCKYGEFTCKAGGCVSEIVRCDGTRDCKDGSDETEAACRNFRCPPYTFKCSYGGCIINPYKCDGVPHCVDSSDESPEACGKPTKPTTKTPPPSVVTAITPTSSSDTHVCDPDSSVFQAPPSTACGVRPVTGERTTDDGGTPFILQGDETKPGEFPWHAGIFKTYNGGSNFKNICGGTLISSKLIISAAHCFWSNSGNKLDQPTTYRVVLGKYHAEWTVKDEKEQMFEVVQFKINCYYNHRQKYYDEDIAVAVLSGTVEFTELIYPICIDWGQKYRFTAHRGVVVGWGLDEHYSTPGSLKKVWLPFVDISVCRRSVPATFGLFFSRRKFCAGSNSGTGVCDGDSGGGLVFRASDTDAWYLRGIVSTGVQNNTIEERYCSLKDYALFTDLYEFLPWLRLVYIP